MEKETKDALPRSRDVLDYPQHAKYRARIEVASAQRLAQEALQFGETA